MAHFKFKVFLNLIRALFPQWNFFDRVAFTFELYFKLNTSESWQKINFDQKHTPLGLFANSKCNLSLAQFNTIEHFAIDVQEQATGSKITDLTTYHLLKSLLATKISEMGLTPTEFQFKVSAISPTEKIDLYISPWIQGQSL